MDWFRWYHGTCADAKLAGIARRLKLPRTSVIAVWAMVLESASSGTDRGEVKHDADDVAAVLDMKTADVDRVLDAMRAPERRLLDGSAVANWGKRQFKSDDVTARVRSIRDKTKRPRNDDETLHEQRGNAPETETETETEREDDAIASARAAPEPVEPDGLAEQTAAAEKPTSTRGTRLPAGWLLSNENLEFARALGLGVGDASMEADKFRDYWRAQPGQRGVKTDWDGTWRNWIRKAIEDGRKYPGSRARQQPRSVDQDRAGILEGLGLAPGMGGVPCDPAGPDRGSADGRADPDFAASRVG